MRVAFLAVLVVLAGCSVQTPVMTISVHDRPVTVFTHEGMRSWAYTTSIHLGVGSYRADWAYLVMHEVCHTVDFSAGASESWPGGSGGAWGARADEQWADACAYEWHRSADRERVVATWPDPTVDTSLVPPPERVTLETWRRACRSGFARACEGDVWP